MLLGVRKLTESTPHIVPECRPGDEGDEHAPQKLHAAVRGDRPDVTSQTQPDTSELRQALEHCLSEHFGVERSVARLSRRPSAYATSAPIEELDVSFEDGSSLALVFKALGDVALSDTARRAKPAFLREPLREMSVYRQILQTEWLGTATYYGAVIDGARDRFWLFLERVPGVGLYQVGEMEIWKDAARWLARLHSNFGPGIESWKKEAPLLRYDAALYRVWLDRARSFMGPREEGGHFLGWLAERYDRVVERLSALPVTFLHGEFYASNVLADTSGGQTRVCPVDWEMAAAGPGLIDLAALVTGGWSEEARMSLARAYHEALDPVPAEPAAWDDFVYSLGLCRLHLAIQWLGWSQDWSPPPEHTHDWLTEAIGLAKALKL